MNKQSLLTLLFLSVIPWGHAQGINFQWVQSVLGPAVMDACYDRSGNIVSMGSFNGTFDFDMGPGVHTLTENNGGTFISKLDSNGQYIWAISVGLKAWTSVGYISTDTQNNIYIAGNFMDSADVDPGTGVHMVHSNGGLDMFIMKIDSAGNIVWTKTIGGSSNEFSKAIVCDSFHHVYLTGEFEDTVDFDPGPGLALHHVGGSIASSNAFILQLDSGGQFRWVNCYEGASSGECMLVDDDAHLVTAGYFYLTLDFDTGPGTSVLTSQSTNGTVDVFLLKVDTLGQFIQVKTIGGKQNDHATAIRKDSGGDLYLTGWFVDTADFDPGPGTYTLVSQGSSDIYILKVDASFNFKWARALAGTGQQDPYSIAVDAMKNVYTSGDNIGVVDFDPGPGVYQVYPATAFGFYQFISKLDSNGNFVLAKCIGNQGGSGMGHNKITLDAAGNILGTGWLMGAADFDITNGVHVINNTSGSYWESYYLKLGQCIINRDTISATACDSFTYNGVTYTASGTYADTLENMQGCDSITVIHLTVHYHDEDSITLTACNKYHLGTQVLTASGQYSDTLVNSWGCDSIVHLDLTIMNLNTAVTQNGLVLTAPSGVNFQWLNCPSFTPIIGAIFQSYTVTANGSYAVRMTNGICYDTSTCITFTEVSTHDLENEAGMILYPNPVRDELQVNWTQHFNDIHIQLSTVQGTVLGDYQLHDQSSLRLSVAHLQKGVYLLTFSGDQQVYHMRWLKE